MANTGSNVPMMPKSAMARRTRVAVDAQSCLVQRSSFFMSTATFSASVGVSSPPRAVDAAP